MFKKHQAPGTDAILRLISYFVLKLCSHLMEIIIIPVAQPTKQNA